VYSSTAVHNYLISENLENKIFSLLTIASIEIRDLVNFT